MGDFEAPVKPHNTKDSWKQCNAIEGKKCTVASKPQPSGVFDGTVKSKAQSRRDFEGITEK